MQSFHSGLAGSTLVAALTAKSQILTLRGVPADLAAGQYSLKLDSELVIGTYPGTGRTFGDLQRGLEGTSAASHRAGVVVHHPITGAALNQLARLTQLDPQLFVRTAATRDYLGANFN